MLQVNTSKEKDESEQHSISHKHKLSLGSIKPIGKGERENNYFFS